jgi:hypothetical protein
VKQEQEADNRSTDDDVENDDDEEANFEEVNDERIRGAVAEQLRMVVSEMSDEGLQLALSNESYNEEVASLGDTRLYGNDGQPKESDNESRRVTDDDDDDDDLFCDSATDLHDESTPNIVDENIAAPEVTTELSTEPNDITEITALTESIQVNSHEETINLSLSMTHNYANTPTVHAENTVQMDTPVNNETQLLDLEDKSDTTPETLLMPSESSMIMPETIVMPESASDMFAQPQRTASAS